LKRILSIGNSLTDILIRMSDDSLLTKLAYPKGSMNLISEEQMHEIEQLIGSTPAEIRSGGSAANTTHALATLGVPCGFVGKIGPDETGVLFSNQLQHVGVRLMAVALGKAPSGRCFVLISPDGERTFATYLGSALELCADDLKPEFFKEFDLLHIEGYLLQNIELINKAFSLAKQQAMAISLDLASYNVVLSNLEVIRTLCAEYVTILFANEEEGKAFAGVASEEVILQQMASHGAVSILKLGARGAKLRHETETIEMPAVISHVQDTTGAGDIFAAGYLAGYAYGKDKRDSLQWGAELASEIIRIVGARLPEKTIRFYKKKWGI